MERKEMEEGNKGTGEKGKKGKEGEKGSRKENMRVGERERKRERIGKVLSYLGLSLCRPPGRYYTDISSLHTTAD